MILAFILTLISTILAYHYLSPILALLVVLAIGAYLIIDTVKTY